MYLIIYLGLTVLFSLIALIAYFRDKKLAVKGKERTKEKTLLFLAVFFGSVGAFLGRILAHHKTDKKYFSMVIYFSMLMQVVTIAALVIFILA
ncbi:MAG: DUF1294 domain-containing protein [Bacilli bacterium]|nr:DUF1294 domain-containing protein [Bacilli bacterium]